MLPPDRRYAAEGLLVLTIIGTGLETLGVGIIVPAIGLLTTQDLATSSPSLGPWLKAFGYHSNEQAVTVVMVSLVVIYAVKTAYLAYLAWRQARFSFDLLAGISQRLFVGYLRQPWTFHLQRNSAQLLRNVTTEVNNFNNVTQAVISVVTDGFVLVALGVLLVVAEPVGTSVVISTLGLAAWAFQRITHQRLIHWGEERQRSDGYRIQHVQQGLGGVKDVKLLGREAEFLAQYDSFNRSYARVAQRMVTLQQLPRLWLEFLAVVGLATLVLVMLGQGRALEALLPILALFAAAAFRLMPSVVRVMNSFQALRYYQPVIDTLDHELFHLDAPAPAEAQATLALAHTIALSNVSFQYPNSSSFALCEVSLTIGRGESVGFVGGSGAGKSTLVDVVLGLLSPTSGSVMVDGVDIRSRLGGWQRQVGYVPQAIFLIDDTLRRNVAFGLPEDQIDDVAVNRALEAAQLTDFVRSLPAGVESTVGERGVQLSGGQRQRVGIARALYHDPPVLVLDEATSSLDTATELGVMDAVRRLHGDKTILIVAHRLSTVAECDKLFRLEYGRIVAEGSLEDVTEAKNSKA